MALYEPGLGYYVNGLHKFGAAGDFVTAPEQGGLFARAVAGVLDEVGRELGADWTLLEPGPGSGALARDLLTAMRHPPARCLLLEPSAALRDVQAETLASLPAELGGRIEWVAAPPAEPFDGVVLANEVVDALPVHHFRIAETGLEEACVTVENARFAWQWRPAGQRLTDAVANVLDDLKQPLVAGYASEICLMLPEWLESVTAALNRGLALFVDYGYPRREYYHGDRADGTLVCHYRHRAHFDPFVWPGLTDISAFVDFTALAEAGRAAGLELCGFTTQGGFLVESGVGEAIERADDEAERLRLAGEFKRLVLPGEMGERFKVLGLTRGFEPWLPGLDRFDRTGRL
jgi:SAM-dependent MidA family methyltransferase